MSATQRDTARGREPIRERVERCFFEAGCAMLREAWDVDGTVVSPAVEQRAFAELRRGLVASLRTVDLNGLASFTDEQIRTQFRKDIGPSFMAVIASRRVS